MTMNTETQLDTSHVELQPTTQQQPAGQAQRKKRSRIAEKSSDDGDGITRASGTGDPVCTAISYSAAGLTLKVTEAQAAMLGRPLGNAVYEGPQSFTTDCVIGDRRVEVGYRASAQKHRSPQKIKDCQGEIRWAVELDVTNGVGKRSGIEVVFGHSVNDGRKEHWIRVNGRTRALLKGQSICPPRDAITPGGFRPSLCAVWPFVVVLALCKASSLNSRAHNDMLQAVLAGVQPASGKPLRIADEEPKTWLRPVAQAVATLEKARGLCRERAVAELVNDLGHLCNFDMVDFLETVEEGIAAWAMQQGWGGAARVRINIIENALSHHFIRTIQKHKELMPVCIVTANKNIHIATALKPHFGDSDNEAFVVTDGSSQNDIDHALRLSKLCVVVGSTGDFTRSQPLTRVVKSMIARKMPIRVLSTEPTAAWTKVLVAMGVPNYSTLVSHYDIQFSGSGAKSIEQFVKRIVRSAQRNKK